MCGIGLCQIFLRLSSHQMNCERSCALFLDISAKHNGER
ncbi:hypothetical protein T09_9428 [Trichinella sp. T9]|nr:hypothetical protein T09_13411 [Trichinella sp. T9]KRX31291.1 hypothetical protein T09_9428 [Trichinella sp. T9]